MKLAVEHKVKYVNSGRPNAMRLGEVVLDSNKNTSKLDNSIEDVTKVTKATVPTGVVTDKVKSSSEDAVTELSKTATDDFRNLQQESLQNASDFYKTSTSSLSTKFDASGAIKIINLKTADSDSLSNSQINKDENPSAIVAAKED